MNWKCMLCFCCMAECLSDRNVNSNQWHYQRYCFHLLQYWYIFFFGFNLYVKVLVNKLFIFSISFKVFWNLSRSIYVCFSLILWNFTNLSFQHIKANNTVQYSFVLDFNLRHISARFMSFVVLFFLYFFCIWQFIKEQSIWKVLYWNTDVMKSYKFICKTLVMRCLNATQVVEQKKSANLRNSNFHVWISRFALSKKKLTFFFDCC